jgi:hypothetical protein
MAGNKNWRAWLKATYLLAVMHSGHTEVAYKDTVKVLKGSYRNHQLAMEYCSQLGGKSVQEFATAIEQLAHQVLVRLPEHFIYGAIREH